MKKSSTKTKSIIDKNSGNKGYTPEEEIKYLIERGDWELLLTSQFLKNRTPEAQAQIIREALDNRLNQLVKTLHYLVNRGEEYHAAATGVTRRIHELQQIRDNILKQIYEQYPRVLTATKGKKIDF